MVRRIAWVVVAVVLLAGIAWALWPRPILVETGSVENRDLVLQIDNEGRSQVREVFTVSAPIAGRMARLDLHAGDSVTKGETVVAEIRPLDPGLLDSRSRQVSQARMQAAQSAVDLAEAERDRASAQLSFAQSALDRQLFLSERGTVPETATDQARFDLSTARSALASAEASLKMRQDELQATKAELIEGNDEASTPQCCMSVYAPASGLVLRVLTESEQVVQPGAPLLTLGDPSDIEIVVPTLSSDAVGIAVGADATIDGWGGPPLAARVTRIDPAARTVVSALGIEEQRVDVILALAEPVPQGYRLGHDFRVIAHITTWRGDGVLAVPAGALFRHGNDWAVFVVSGGKAQRRIVQIGHQNADYGEVLSGLKTGEAVVLYPNDQLADGSAVTISTGVEGG